MQINICRVSLEGCQEYVRKKDLKHSRRIQLLGTEVNIRIFLSENGNEIFVKCVILIQEHSTILKIFIVLSKEDISKACIGQSNLD